MKRKKAAVKKINDAEAKEIIKTYEPRGLFYVKCGSDQPCRYTAIDNSTGDAWTEDFNSRIAMFRWLREYS